MTRDSTALFCYLVLQPSVDEYMGMTKRSPSPPEACRNQILPDWWVQQSSAGECGYPAPATVRLFMYGRRYLPLLGSMSCRRLLSHSRGLRQPSCSLLKQAQGSWLTIGSYAWPLSPCTPRKLRGVCQHPKDSREATALRHLPPSWLTLRALPESERARASGAGGELSQE